MSEDGDIRYPVWSEDPLLLREAAEIVARRIARVAVDEDADLEHLADLCGPAATDGPLPQWLPERDVCSSAVLGFEQLGTMSNLFLSPADAVDWTVQMAAVGGVLTYRNCQRALIIGMSGFTALPIREWLASLTERRLKLVREVVVKGEALVDVVCYRDSVNAAGRWLGRQAKKLGVGSGVDDLRRLAMPIALAMDSLGMSGSGHSRENVR